MKILKIISLLFIIIVLTTSCEDETEQEVSDLGLVKTAVVNDLNSDGFVQVGETITYTFKVTNTGDNTISQIVINDDRIAVQDLSLNPSELTPSASASISVDYTITSSDLTDESITNQATVSGVDDEGVVITDLSDNDSNYADNETITTLDIVPYANGIFILNEGNYGSGNASITFVKNDFSSIEQEVFKTVNSDVLGDTAQSIYLTDDRAYIVVNGSNKIEVVNRYTMEQVVTIEGASINNPRYMVVHNGIGYISNWGDAADPNDDFISIIDLATNSVTGIIPVEVGPEKMEVIGDKVYVAMIGAWNTNNKILVIDTTSNTVVSNIDLGDNPNSMIVDGNYLYVVSGGISYPISDETAGRIDKIDISTNTVTATWNFNATEHPYHLTHDGSSFYYSLNGGVYKWDGIVALPISPENGLDGFYYGMITKDGLLYALDAGDYQSEGTLKIFDLSSNTQTQSITTGIIPNGVVFN